MEKPYEVISHTADAGFRVWGENWESLLRNAARAFYDLLTDSESIHAKDVEKRISVSGADRIETLVAWLAELIYFFDAERILFCSFVFERATDGEIVAVVRGEPYNEDTHAIQTDIKAVTYHGVQVNETDRGLEAQIIFDL